MNKRHAWAVFCMDALLLFSILLSSFLCQEDTLKPFDCAQGNVGDFE